jgi:5-formyltetrahydrofolate cyclo-ligase
VPGIGFDIFGNRIGHGLGYYDDLLKRSEKSINIGLSFESQIIDNIPTDENDIPVDYIITEERTIKCKQI